MTSDLPRRDDSDVLETRLEACPQSAVIGALTYHLRPSPVTGLKVRIYAAAHAHMNSRHVAHKIISKARIV